MVTFHNPRAPIGYRVRLDGDPRGVEGKLPSGASELDEDVARVLLRSTVTASGKIRDVRGARGATKPSPTYADVFRAYGVTWSWPEPAGPAVAERGRR